jgi:2-oxoglutarate dehydrogenase E2 component (dihydrolipoamide succinyltransferase)
MRHELILPDLGVDEVAVSLWLVESGTEVVQGDRLIEVVADGVTVDLPAPASGVLIETLVAEDDPLAIGQVLGVVESRS